MSLFGLILSYTAEICWSISDFSWNFFYLQVFKEELFYTPLYVSFFSALVLLFFLCVCVMFLNKKFWFISLTFLCVTSGTINCPYFCLLTLQNKHFLWISQIRCRAKENNIFGTLSAMEEDCTKFQLSSYWEKKIGDFMFLSPMSGKLFYSLGNNFLKRMAR